MSAYLADLLRTHLVESVDLLVAAASTLHNDPTPEGCELFEDAVRYLGKVTRALSEALRTEGSE